MTALLTALSKVLIQRIRSFVWIMGGLDGCNTGFGRLPNVRKPRNYRLLDGLGGLDGYFVIYSFCSPLGNYHSFMILLKISCTIAAAAARSFPNSCEYTPYVSISLECPTSCFKCPSGKAFTIDTNVCRSS